VKVALTGTRAEPLADLLRAELFEVLHRPLVRIEPFEGPPIRVADYDWLVLTSRNAVECLFRRLDGPLPRLAVIGPGTAQALRARGVEPTLVARRATQEEYNRLHGITPKTIEKAIAALEGSAQDDFVDVTKPAKKAKEIDIPLEELPQIISAMRREMFDLSESLEFEKAAALRDKIKDLEEIRLSLGGR